jgi:hypothetical protein
MMQPTFMYVFLRSDQFRPRLSRIYLLKKKIKQVHLPIQDLLIKFDHKRIKLQFMQIVRL